MRFLHNLFCKSTNPLVSLTSYDYFSFILCKNAMKERKALQTTKMRYLDKLLFFSFKKLANYPFQVFVDHSQLMIVFTYNTASINKHSNGF